MTVSQLAEGISKGKRRHLAKAITLIESSRGEDQHQAAELLSALPKRNDTLRLGISGVPGVGKSTFIEAFGNLLIEQGHRVAVLAVDPSSPTTGGSILGDKTRMELLAGKEEAFIRPSPTAGTLGGVAKKTRESIRLCEAAGYDIVLVETVGVGQSEFEVASMVDCFMVLMLPGAGDSLQGIKRGILEITDVMVINKADGDQKKLAEMAKSDYKNAFHMLAPKYPGMEVAILTISALQQEGIAEVWEAVNHFKEHLITNKLFHTNRNKQDLNWFKRLVEDEVLHKIWSRGKSKPIVEELKRKMMLGEISATEAARRMIDEIS